MIQRFVFPIETLKTEVEKRTSYLGKMRRTDDVPDAQDRLALTEGESFLSDEYLDEAASETYDWIKAFGRTVKRAYLITPVYTMKSVVANERVKMYCGGKQQMGLSALLPVKNTSWVELTPKYIAHIEDMELDDEMERDTAYDDDSGATMLYGWTTKDNGIHLHTDTLDLADSTPVLSVITGTQVGTVNILDPYDPDHVTYRMTGDFDPVTVDTGEAASVVTKLDVKWREGSSTVPTVDEKHTEHLSRTDTANFSVSSFAFDVTLDRRDPTFGKALINGIDSIEVWVDEITPKSVVNICKGDYVCYEDVEGKVSYGVVTQDGLPPVSNDWYEEDVNHSVVFSVDVPDWSDENMIPAVKRNLKEALVNYVIYRWFETVNPREADAYRDKFDEKGHQAQLGLNTEKRPLQRKAGWLDVDEWG